MTLNDIVALLKEGLDNRFFDLDRTVWVAEFPSGDRIDDYRLRWQIRYQSDDFQNRMSDVDALILQTLVRHNIFSDIGDNWYRINPAVVQTIYEQLNKRR